MVKRHKKLWVNVLPICLNLSLYQLNVHHSLLYEKYYPFHCCECHVSVKYHQKGVACYLLPIDKSLCKEVCYVRQVQYIQRKIILFWKKRFTLLCSTSFIMQRLSIQNVVSIH